MKIAKRISIALLAACVIGGSAVAMTACGGSAPEPTPDVSSDPSSVVSQVENSTPSDNQADVMLLKNLNMISGQMVRVIDGPIQDRFGREYDGGVQYDASENSYATYNLDRKYSRFTATAYPSTEATGGKNMWISIYVDDELVYHKQGITEDKQPIEIEADVLGADILKIETGNEGSFSCGYLILSDGQFDARTVEEKTDAEPDEEPAVVLDYSGAYLTAYDKKPFQTALDEAIDLKYGSDERLSDYEIKWYSDWDQLDLVSAEEASMSWLKEGEVPVSCNAYLEWDPITKNDPQYFHIYLGYNQAENTLRVVKLNIHYETNRELYRQEGAYNTLLQYLRVLG